MRPPYGDELDPFFNSHNPSDVLSPSQIDIVVSQIFKGDYEDSEAALRRFLWTEQEAEQRRLEARENIFSGAMTAAALPSKFNGQKYNAEQAELEADKMFQLTSLPSDLRHQYMIGVLSAMVGHFSHDLKVCEDKLNVYTAD